MAAAAARRRHTRWSPSCGRTAARAPNELRPPGIAAAYPLSDLRSEPDPQRCIDDAGPLLEQLGERIARRAAPHGRRCLRRERRHEATYDLADPAERASPPPASVARASASRDGTDRRDRAARSRTCPSARQRRRARPTTRCCCRASSTPTSTSTSPGRTEWEGFATATRAAAAGGVTTIVDMPLNSIPPTVDVAALEVKRKAAERRGVRRRRVLGRRHPRQHRRPARAARRRRVRLQVLPAALGRRRVPAPGSGRARGRPARDAQRSTRCMIVHAEDSDAIDRAPIRARRALRRLPGLPAAGGRERGHRARHRSRPVDRRRVHILHLSELRRPADDPRRRGATASASPSRPARTTCVFTAEEIPDGATQFKCCPPIREAANRELLWAGLPDGDDRLRRLRPLAVHAGAQAPRHRRLRGGLGRDRRRSSSGCPRSGPRPASAASPSATWSRWMSERPGRPWPG